MMIYEIIVGEVGNEQGYIHLETLKSDAEARRKANKLVAPYKGDGWYIVKDYLTGETISKAGRFQP